MDNLVVKLPKHRIWNKAQIFYMIIAMMIS